MDNNINDNEIEKIIGGAKPRISGGNADAAHVEKFKGVLKTQVLSEFGRAGMIKEKLTVQSILMKNLRYWVAGAAVLAVAAIAVFVATPKQNGGGGIALLGSNANVTHVADQAFGNLNSLSAITAVAPQSATGETSANSAMASGAGATSANGTAPKAAALNMAVPAGTTGSGGSAGTNVAAPAPSNSMLRYPYPAPQTVKYVYKGDTFTQDQAAMDVLKYVVTPISADQATTALGQANLGLTLGSFGDIALENITLSQDQDFGYTVNIDLLNGTLNIYQNYLKWPQDNNPQPLTASDVPSDGAVIKIANQFLSDHSFAMGNYGSPEVVQNNYGYAVPMGMQSDVAPTTQPAPSAGAKANTSAGVSAGVMIPYYPDTVEVLYPLAVNGKTVYDASGNKIGLNVQVNVRYNRVSNISGVSAQNYQASSYAAITDVDKILSLAENPPFYPIIYEGPMMGAGVSGGATITPVPPNSFTIGNEIDFGTPTLGYATMYNYANGQNDEFLVPAYIFPILSSSSNSYYGGSKNIVVPLIADFLQDQNSGKIVPLGASTGASAPGASVPPPVSAPAPKPAVQY